MHNAFHSGLVPLFQVQLDPANASKFRHENSAVFGGDQGLAADNADGVFISHVTNGLLVVRQGFQPGGLVNAANAIHPCFQLEAVRVVRRQLGVVGGVHGQGRNFRDDHAGKFRCHVFRREAGQRQTGNHLRVGGLDLHMQILHDGFDNGFHGFLQLAFQPASGGHVIGRDQERAAVTVAHNAHRFRFHGGNVPVFRILDCFPYFFCNFNGQCHSPAWTKSHNFIREIRGVTVQGCKHFLDFGKALACYSTPAQAGNAVRVFRHVHAGLLVGHTRDREQILHFKRLVSFVGNSHIFCFLIVEC